MWIILGLALGTLVSEDASLAGAAGLARAGAVSPLAAGAAVALGIWAGDLGLFLAGRFAAPVLPGSVLRARVGPIDGSRGVAFDVVVGGDEQPVTVLAGGWAELA